MLLTNCPELVSPLRPRARNWNASLIDQLAALRRQDASVNGCRRLVLRGAWMDVEAPLDHVQIRDARFSAIVRNLGSRECFLRFAFLGPDGSEAEFISPFAPGVTMLRFAGADLRYARQESGRMTRALFGGEGLGESRSA
jgi:hypothetical protein